MPTLVVGMFVSILPTPPISALHHLSKFPFRRGLARKSLFLNYLPRVIIAVDRKESAAMLNGFDSPTGLSLLIAAQFLGVFSAFLARLSEGSCCQFLGQFLFFGALPLVGAATMVALAIGPGCWVACAATLAAMILTVTCDFRGSRKAATW